MNSTITQICRDLSVTLGSNFRIRFVFNPRSPDIFLVFHTHECVLNDLISDTYYHRELGFKKPLYMYLFSDELIFLLEE